MQTNVVKLSEAIAPVYHPLCRLVRDEEFMYYWVKGGRTSAKSSTVSLIISIELRRDGNAHAVCFMKTATGMEEKIYEQFLWAFDVLGLSNEWKGTKKPLRFTNIITGQKILFRGLDDPGKSKGIKFSKGYAKCIWFEELAEFDNWEEIRQTLQSVLRKSDAGINVHQSVFLTYNPPREPNNWVNKLAKESWPNRYVLETTYLDIPQEWITESMLQDIEHLKERDPRAYEHEYLGKPTGRDGLVYPQFSRERHIIKELEQGEQIWEVIAGCDGGTINDSTTLIPLACTTLGRVVCLPTFVYDPRPKEVMGHQPLATFDQVALMVQHLDTLAMRFGFNNTNVIVVVDSAAQDIVLEFNRSTYYAAKPVKKKDIMVDMRRVQGFLGMENYFAILNEGYKDPLNQELLHEDDMLITELESKVINPKTGKPEDGNDHSIDAFKYGTHELMMRGGL